MYKHILVPTDGSELSHAAAAGAIELARALGARITAFHVTPQPPASVLEAWVHGSRESALQLEALFEANARRYLAKIRDRAREAGVRCQCVHLAGVQVYDEIIKAARARHCDLIYMASHGRRGTADVILGSETIKVLTHSPIPVLVHRHRSVPAASRVQAKRSKRS